MEQHEKAKITVFTPVYNRADTLPRLYESLKRQTDQSFVWIIVNDGQQMNQKNSENLGNRT